MNTLDYQHIFHEIKNSITLISSSMQLLEHNLPSLQSECHWTNTMNEVGFLKNMILEISQAGNTDHLKLQNTNINTIIQQLCHLLKDTYPNIEWNLELDHSLQEIRLDSGKIQQALLNLVKNSIEAMKGQGTISLHSNYSNQQIVVNITDCGGGIAPELEPKIFDLFMTSKKQGTGLGLAITRHIIHLHHGTLEFTNAPGDGCTFSIMLPIC